MNYELRTTNCSQAFTLAEAVLVTAVFAILVCVLVPVVYHMREVANDTRCLGNLHQIAIAVRIYSDEYGMFPMTLSCRDSQGDTAVADGRDSWWSGSYAYAGVLGWMPGMKDALICPSDPTPYPHNPSYSLVIESSFVCALPIAGSQQGVLPGGSFIAIEADVKDLRVKGDGPVLGFRHFGGKRINLSRCDASSVSKTISSLLKLKSFTEDDVPEKALVNTKRACYPNEEVLYSTRIDGDSLGTYMEIAPLFRDMPFSFWDLNDDGIISIFDKVIIEDTYKQLYGE